MAAAGLADHRHHLRLSVGGGHQRLGVQVHAHGAQRLCQTVMRFGLVLGKYDGLP